MFAKSKVLRMFAFAKTLEIIIKQKHTNNR